LNDEMDLARQVAQDRDPLRLARLGAAAERIRLQLAAAASTEPAVEMHFSIPNPWSRRLLIAALPPVTRWSGEPSPAMSAY